MNLVQEAARLAREVRRNPDELARYNYPPKMELATTCCCHIVVDDQNFSDSSAAFCLKQAEAKEHPKCRALTLLLVQASRTQRRRINYMAWFWNPPDMEVWS